MRVWLSQDVNCNRIKLLSSWHVLPLATKPVPFSQFLLCVCVHAFHVRVKKKEEVMAVTVVAVASAT